MSGQSLDQPLRLRLITGDLSLQKQRSSSSISETVQTQTPSLTSDTTVTGKKRGRKKKVEISTESIAPINIIKNYVVQLKVKAGDLEKIQRFGY